VLFIALFTVLLTNLGSNTVAAVISFQLAALLVPAGMSLAVLAVIVAFACRAAFCLPSSFVGVGTIYGEEWANTKKILPYGLIMSLGAVLLLTLVGYPIGMLLF
jgi:di/tricarboxylate transporter